VNRKQKRSRRSNTLAFLVERSNLVVKVAQRGFQQLAVAWVLGMRELLENPVSSKLKIISLQQAPPLLWRNPRACPHVLLSGKFDLLFYRFALPATCHKSSVPQRPRRRAKAPPKAATLPRLMMCQNSSLNRGA
jgi:hypothetical protein